MCPDSDYALQTVINWMFTLVAEVSANVKILLAVNLHIRYVQSGAGPHNK